MCIYIYIHVYMYVYNYIYIHVLEHPKSSLLEIQFLSTCVLNLKLI